jgi:predicted adenylyl cyclase CyaB
MRRNVEIKARITDLSQLRERIESIADRGPRVIHQEDTFFRCSNGRLKLRRFSEQECELIFYQRPDTTQPIESRYSRASSHEPDALIELLAQAIGVRGAVQKRRTLYWLGQTRLHLDEVEGLGPFLELEVVLEPSQSTSEGVEIADQIMKRLRIQEKDLIESAYIDLLEQRHKEKGDWGDKEEMGG